MKMISSRFLLVVIPLAGIVLIAWYFLSANYSKTDISLEQRQEEFTQFVDTAQLRNKNLVFESAGPLCVESNADGRTDCTLSKTFIYKLDGNYRDNGEELFTHLKGRGFDFREDTADKVEKKLKDTAITDNLSNSEPIIVDMYHTKNDTRVRVSLGDRGRTLPYAHGQMLDQLSDGQLIAGLQFYNP